MVELSENVPDGHRVRRGNEYPPLYSTLLADRPAAGQRTMQFVVRLDIRNSVPGLQYRQSVGAAAAVAATEGYAYVAQHKVFHPIERDYVPMF